MQSSLKASLTHCAKIAQGVLTADKIIDTPLCAPPTAQKNKYKFFTPSNVLGKEHYRLNVVWVPAHTAWVGIFNEIESQGVSVHDISPEPASDWTAYEEGGHP